MSKKKNKNKSFNNQNTKAINQKTSKATSTSGANLGTSTIDSSKSKSKFAQFLDKINTPFVQKVGSTLRAKWYLYPSFLIPVFILFIVFALMGVYPFGGRAVLTLDMNGQYVYFFDQLRDVFTGKASLLYTFERSLGGEFFGYFTYYLASPLSYIVVLFPNKMLTEAIMTILLVKCGLSGLTFSIYLDNTKKKNPLAFTMFSVMYALCSFAIMYQANTMWMDALIWLPLIALGIESLVKEGKFKLFVISLAIAIWSNYYIGYMLCIFVALYFFCFIGSHTDKEINYIGETRHKLKSLARIAIFSVVALMIASTIIFTAYYSLQFGKSDLQDNSFDPNLRFDLLNLFAKFFIGSYDTVRSQGTPNIYAGTLMLLMLPVYFMSKKIKPREKICYSVLCVIFIASFSINTLDLVWHGFQMPIWMNYRYSFLFSFILLLMAYKGYEHLDDINVGVVGKTSVFLIAMLFIIQKTVSFTRYKGGEEISEMPDYAMVWLSILFILLYLLVIYVRKHTKLPQTTAVLLVLVVCIEAFSSTLINWFGETADAGLATREGYRTYVDNLEAVTDDIYEKDDGFFRIEKTQFRKPNDGLAININGVTEFTSTFNKSTLEFLKRLGIYGSFQTTKYISGNEVLDSILGIKYMLASSDKDENGKYTDKVSGLYTPITTSNGIVVYENPYAFPIAFSASNTLASYSSSVSYRSYFDNIDYLLSKIVGTSSTKVFEPLTYKILDLTDIDDKTIITSSLDKMDGIVDGKYNDNTKNCTVRYIIDDSNNTVQFRRISDSSKASVTFDLTAKYDGSIYMHLPSKFTTSATCYVDGVKLSNLFSGEDNRIFNIGNYKAGDKVSVTVEFDHYRLYLYDLDNFFVQINEKALSQISTSINAEGLKVEKHSSTRIKGTLTASSDKMVFTTIPFDKGWKVYVDGERVDTFVLANAMVGFEISEGTHQITMKYAPAPFYAGLAVTFAGITIFVVLCILDRRWRKNIVICPPSTEEPEENDSESNNTSQNVNGTINVSEENK